MEFWPVRTLHGVHPVLAEVDVAARLGGLLDLARHLFDDPRHLLCSAAANVVVDAAGLLFSDFVTFSFLHLNTYSSSLKQSNSAMGSWILIM